jgi:uncharacterized membrane protein
MLTLPPWEGMHPLVVHFPIALLLFAPALLVVGLLDRRRRWGWLLAGLLTLAAGTAGSFVAVMSGEATAEAVESTVTPAVRAAIEEHEELGELARTLFAVLTVWLALTLAAVRLPAGVRKAAVPAAAVLFAAGYAGSAFVLVRAGHEGGRLVHEMGVRAPVASPTPTPTGPQASGRSPHDDDD